MSILIDLHSANRGANGLLSGLSAYQLQGLSVAQCLSWLMVMGKQNSTVYHLRMAVAYT